MVKMVNFILHVFSTMKRKVKYILEAALWLGLTGTEDRVCAPCAALPL
jgi:hypothetical protein